MAVLAKPDKKIQVIPQNVSPEFVRKFNNNKLSGELKNSCEKAGRLFGVKKK